MLIYTEVTRIKVKGDFLQVANAKHLLHKTKLNFLRNH